MAQASVQRIEESEVELIKLPPHSVEAEQSVLGGLLLDNSAWDRIAATGHLPGMRYRCAHGRGPGRGAR